MTLSLADAEKCMLLPTEAVSAAGADERLQACPCFETAETVFRPYRPAPDVSESSAPNQELRFAALDLQLVSRCASMALLH